MLTIAYPAVLLLLPLPIIIRLSLKTYRRTEAAVKIPFFARLVHTFTPQRNKTAISKTSIIHSILTAICWGCIVLALARPQYIEKPIIHSTPTRDLLLVVDLSGSMDTMDFTNSRGEKTDRLTAVKEVAGEFLAKRKGDRVGLIVFGNAAFVQVPFTQDLEACRILLNETAVRMAGPRTAFGDAIGLGITLFEKSNVKERVIIVLTDGNDTGSRVLPVDAAKIAADRKIKIYTIGIGDPTAAGEEKLDEETLGGVAEIANGHYYHADNRKELESIYNELDQLETKKVETKSYRPRRDLFHLPLALMLILTLLYYLPSLFRFRKETQ